jgi:hypothetical protein
MALNERIIAKLRAQGRDAIPGGTEKWLAAHRLVHGIHFHAANHSHSINGCAHIYEGARPTSILPTPSMPGRKVMALSSDGLRCGEILALPRDRDRGDLGRSWQRAPGERPANQPASGDADIPGYHAHRPAITR